MCKTVSGWIDGFSQKIVYKHITLAVIPESQPVTSANLWLRKLAATSGTAKVMVRDMHTLYSRGETNRVAWQVWTSVAASRH